MSWKEVLSAVHKTFKEKRNDIETQANNLTEHIANSNTFISAGENEFKKEDLLKMSTNILAQADSVWGGYGQSPKFPHTFIIQYQLRDFHFFKNQLSLDHALLSLDKLIQGGIYDHLAGGFARYSTDEKWLAPHFEKMLYDNALLLETLCEAYQITQKETYRNVIIQTFNFIQNEMMSDEFGFYSAYDADSEGVEGKYYTWSKSEIDSLLKEDSEIFCNVYNVSEHGNWEETNILWLPESVEIFAEKNGFQHAELAEKLKRCRSLLVNERNKRIKPLLDDKQLLSWNALMNICCCKIYAALGLEEAKQLALNNIRFIENRFLAAEAKHSYKNGESKIDAFLDDCAYLIKAYLQLQEITGDFNYLEKGKALTEKLIESFSDEEQLMFYFTSKHQKDIIVRKKEVYDGATPSANAVMADNLRYLSKILDRRDWGERSDKMIASLKKAIVQYPTSFGYWGKLVVENFFGTDEIAIVGKKPKNLIKEYLLQYHPNRIFQFSETQTDDYPLLAGKEVENKALIYVCKAYSCKQPVSSVSDLIPMINEFD